MISRVSKENNELKLPTYIPNDAISPWNTAAESKPVFVNQKPTWG